MKRNRTLGWLSLACCLGLACNRAEEAAPAPIAPGTVSASPVVEPATPDLYADELAAMPRWVLSSNRGSTHRSAYASQIPNADTELEQAAPLGPGFVGVLLCHLEVTEQRAWDSPGVLGRHGKPDIVVTSGAGDTRVHAIGPNNSYVFVVSFPNVHLDDGFELKLSDRDVGPNEHIETLQIFPPTESTPFISSVTGERSTARCGGVEQAQAVIKAQTPLDALELLIVQLEARSPPAADEEAIQQLEPARTLARNAAAWLGWVHPTVVAMVGRLETVAALWRMADAESRALPAGSRVQLRRMNAQVLDHTCSEGHCQARVQASYTRTGQAISLVVFTPAGEVVNGAVSSDPPRTSTRRSILAGNEHTHTFEWAGEEPSVVVIRQNQDEAFVRLQ